MSTFEKDLSYLGEVTNVGAGNAATAMATFMQTSFTMAPPLVHQLHLGEALELLHDDKGETTVALLTVVGDLDGILALFVDDPIPYLGVFGGDSSMAGDFVAEMGNIVAARFLGAVEAMVGLSGYHEPPAVATANKSTILETLLAMSAQQEPFVFLRANLGSKFGPADIVFAPSASAVDRIRERVA